MARARSCCDSFGGPKYEPILRWAPARHRRHHPATPQQLGHAHAKLTHDGIPGDPEGQKVIQEILAIWK